MNSGVHIALVGDYNAEVPAHQAIPKAFALAAEALAIPITPQWLPTDTIYDDTQFLPFDGIWCVPASPYKNREGALRAIRFARVHLLPFLGTCGGFQHAVLEYAQGVLGWADAEHAETSPHAMRPVITPLSCSLVEVSDTIRFQAGSQIAKAYGCQEATERYRCRYGLNPTFQEHLVSGVLHITGEDETGEVRALELANHPFFVATLFQPERASLEGRLPPLVTAFVQATQIYSQNSERRMA